MVILLGGRFTPNKNQLFNIDTLNFPSVAWEIWTESNSIFLVLVANVSNFVYLNCDDETVLNSLIVLMGKPGY